MVLCSFPPSACFSVPCDLHPCHMHTDGLTYQLDFFSMIWHSWDSFFSSLIELWIRCIGCFGMSNMKLLLLNIVLSCENIKWPSGISHYKHFFKLEVLGKGWILNSPRVLLFCFLCVNYPGWAAMQPTEMLNRSFMLWCKFYRRNILSTYSRCFNPALPCLGITQIVTDCANKGLCEDMFIVVI